MPSKATESEQAPSKTASTSAVISIGSQSAIASTARARTAERETPKIEWIKRRVIHHAFPALPLEQKTGHGRRTKFERPRWILRRFQCFDAFDGSCAPTPPTLPTPSMDSARCRCCQPFQWILRAADTFDRFCAPTSPTLPTPSTDSALRRCRRCRRLRRILRSDASDAAGAFDGSCAPTPPTLPTPSMDSATIPTIPTLSMVL